MLSRLSLQSVAVRQPAIAAVVACNNGIADQKRTEHSRPKRGNPPPVRLGFLPEEWFQFFHSKTGVTGPYVLGIGVATYCLSKEIYVLEHEYYSGLSIALMVYLGVTKAGPGIAKWLDKEVDDYEAEWNKSRTDTIKSLEDAVKNEKLRQWQALGQEMLIQAKKENVLLQLEAIYRERLMRAYTEVKRRLDYQVAKSDAERRITQRHMVDWIVSNVMKSITADQQKATIDRCIADLDGLAARK